MEYHNPVLLKETVDGLNIQEDGIYVDVTFGGGGHSREILKHLGEKGKLFAFDQDLDALKNKIEDDRFTLINENFRYMNRFLRLYGIKKVDGVLADFGVSSHQFDKPERGFSTRFDAELDMRMNQNDKLSAFHVINEYEEKHLASVLKQYGELRQAPAMARSIVHYRKDQDIKTGESLKQALAKFLGHKKENKVLAQIYQAIRIEVNQELEVIKEFLIQVPELLKPHGRLSVISYHSLEDRLVKRFIRNGMFEGEPERDIYGNFEVPLKKVGKLIVPSKEEIAQNSRARSAKLRVAEKVSLNEK
ncbi:16S rRNA (cytosine(1402)-N(4))-methyltransferase RsmH [Mangrovimonas spongiae]|uniref:Ribosomal RNA small subunit methyltransferase H n=1 Tax=Mangrovimonas spongiae TaxID=2494697 RepID=A0A3R9NUD5_9FLAO|nr:16S rRNA (cytosine(1402)-N(4))-methyltransferase RsmH [Mangrovimonas spongiae]RSK41953.1 16S rRNA (cytosine(1402)-N(4))-methyltransferase RsmH [Mangrovimonas spongiae]